MAGEIEISWSPDMMVEVSLKQPDDFLKVRETLTRIGVASRKERNYFRVVIFFIRRASIISYTLKSCLRWTESTRT